MDLYWWISQSFALLGLIFVIISFQQKGSLKIILFRCIATSFVLGGTFFLGEISVILMCAVGLTRGLTALYFAYKPNTKQWIKYIVGGILFTVLISLNIVFWKNYLNIFSMLVGGGLIIAFFQKDPKLIRILGFILSLLGAVYYGLLFSPINIIVDIVAAISALVGIIRFDVKRNPKTIKNIEKQKEEKPVEETSKK